MNEDYQWLIIGAGPAGILSVGKLLDYGVDSKNIAWIDPCFKVGDIGDKWHQVPSNTLFKNFLVYFNSCAAFDLKNYPQYGEFMSNDPEQTCSLGTLVPPLQWISDQFCKKVSALQDQVISLKQGDEGWHASFASGSRLETQKVILATGSEPLIKDFHQKQDLIPLSRALNPNLLKKSVSAQDKVAVFGASHSGVLILKNLLDLGINTVNFYRSPIRYALLTEHGYLYDNTGLKGLAAEFGKANLSSKLPDHLQRVQIEDADYQGELSHCNKVIYSVGFAARRIPIEGLSKTYDYDAKTGIIAPGIFGFGIAYPEFVTHPVFQVSEYNVGLAKFANYIQRVLPIWCDYASLM